jgi:hypothetical protein
MTQKDKYHIRNWKQYNQSLVSRGSITFWFTDEAIKKWYSNERTKNPGRPDVYSDDTIRCALLIKAVFHVALRQLQGLIMSLIKILGVDVVCPHYSVFSRRAQNLSIPMRRFLKQGEHLNIIFDSTGIKVFGEALLHKPKIISLKYLPQRWETTEKIKMNGFHSGAPYFLFSLWFPISVVNSSYYEA